VKTIRRLLIIVSLAFMLLLVYLAGGFSHADTWIAYRISVSDPTSGFLEVSITITPTAQPFIHLYLHDTVQDGLARISGLSVARGDQLVAHWQTLPGLEDLQTIWLGFNREPVVVTYRIKGQWMQGSNLPRSYLDGNLGCVRGITTLFTPFALQDVLALLRHQDLFSGVAGQATVQFQLPSGWALVSPWGEQERAVPVSAVRNVYFGMGDLSTEMVADQRSLLYVGIFRGVIGSDRYQQVIPEIYRAMRRATGFAPDSHLPMWSLTILPAEVVHGGASGTNSLVVSDDMATIAHEIFHWWNGTTIQTGPDAYWLREGFTTYYAGKMLYKVGIWSRGDWQDYMETLGRQLNPAENIFSINFSEASQNLVKKSDQADYARVYYGGALLAQFLDQRLQEQGQSLDQIWRLLRDSNTTVTSQVFLRALAKLGGPALAQECASLLEGHPMLAYSNAR
jgi:hypothetical protein